MSRRDYTVGVIGLGYVGAPLLNDIINKKIKVFGYDKSLERIKFLNKKKKIYKNNILSTQHLNQFIVWES